MMRSCIFSKRIHEEATTEVAGLKASALEEENFMDQIRELVDEDLKAESEKQHPPGIDLALLQP